MPAGACVIRREGKRGAVFYVKFRDAAGVQVKKRLGREADGWNTKKAERELGKRLDAVERERWRKPDGTTFGAFAERFERDYLPSRNLKRSTLIAYGVDLHRHLVPFFGSCPLPAVDAAMVDAYIAEKARQGLAPKTIGNTLTTLRIALNVAVRWRLISANPVALIDRPRVETPEMNVLTEAEVARLLTAYAELEAQAEPEECPWWRLTRRLVVVALATALRRGELLALTWGDVRLLDRLLTVRRSFVRSRMETPKSRSSRRMMELGPRALEALGEQFAETHYQGDEELVFGHPALGTPLDASKLARDFMRPALRRAGIVKPFRPWHDLRHTALTHEAAAGNPAVYVQMKAGHSQGSITERYVHAAQVLFPGAAEKGESRIFAELGGTKSGTN